MLISHTDFRKTFNFAFCYIIDEAWGNGAVGRMIYDLVISLIPFSETFYTFLGLGTCCKKC